MISLEPDDPQALEDRVAMLAHAFALRDYLIEVAICETGNEGTYADVHFKTHWHVVMTFYNRFFESDPVDQSLTIIHELMHIMHSRVDKFVESIASDDSSRRAYHEIQEEFVEHVERGFKALLSHAYGGEE